MKISSAAKVGFTAILFALALIGVFRGMGWLSLSGRDLKAYQFYVSFTTVKGLAEGGAVQLNGNPIGEVGKITNDGYGGVLVQVKISRGQPIHTHARFAITRDNIFGGYLISIDEPLSGQLMTPVTNDQAVVRIAKGQVDLGGIVKAAGEVIGQIEQIDPVDPRSDIVHIKLEPGIELDEDMAFVPSHPKGGGLGGLEIYTKLKQGAQTVGTREPGPEDLVADVDLALTQVTGEVSQILTQVTELISNLSGMLDKEKVQNLINTVSSQAILIADNIARLTTRLDTLVAENQPHINNTLQNVELVTADAHTLMTDLEKYNSPEFRQKVDDITTNLKTATDSLNKILNDLEGMTSDKEMIGKIKDTINQANSTLKTAEETLGTAKTAIDKAQTKLNNLGKIETGGEFILRNAPDPNVWSGDINVKIGTSKGKTFVEGGVNNLGEDQTFRAEIGRKISKEAAARLGIYKGKLSLGGDYRLDPFSLNTDVYDPNAITWDIYGTYAFSPELGIVVGIEDLLGDNQANVGLKIRF
jgi:ABC-type transporter Mla subunit MlaD